MSDNRNAEEIHGCIVCAKTYTVLAVYTPDGKLIDCTVTSPGGHCLSTKKQPLVACNTHTADEVEAAYKRWQSQVGKDTEIEHDDE